MPRAVRAPPSGESSMADTSLAQSRTLANLKQAFASEAQANQRYLHFAKKATGERHKDVAAVFRATAAEKTSHAHGLLKFLEAAGDPSSGAPIGSTRDNLDAAIASETRDATDIYPRMARIAREEGFEEVAQCFEALAKAERLHADRLRVALSGLG
jgi:rubrerythrin